MLLESNKEEDLKELLGTFPHACKFVKSLDEDIVDVPKNHVPFILVML